MLTRKVLLIICIFICTFGIASADGWTVPQKTITINATGFNVNNSNFLEGYNSSRFVKVIGDNMFGDLAMQNDNKFKSPTINNFYMPNEISSGFSILSSTQGILLELDNDNAGGTSSELIVSRNGTGYINDDAQRLFSIRENDGRVSVDNGDLLVKGNINTTGNTIINGKLNISGNINGNSQMFLTNGSTSVNISNDGRIYSNYIGSSTQGGANIYIGNTSINYQGQFYVDSSGAMVFGHSNGVKFQLDTFAMKVIGNYPLQLAKQGTYWAPALLWQDDGYTGFYLKGRGTFGITANYTDVMEISSSWNARATGGGKVDIKGSVNATGYINTNNSYYINTIQGITVNGTACTITNITGGIITGATCI